MILFFAGRFTKTPKEIKSIINSMLARGEIFEKRKGEFKITGEDKKLIKGKVIGNSKGYAFLVPQDRTLPDFFIAPKKLNGAMDGDLVLAKILEQTEEVTECEVVSILENTNKTIVGTITYVNKKNAFVIPDNKKLSKDIFVPQNMTKGAKQGYRVVVKLNKNNTDKLSGEVVEVLGESDDIASLELGIIREHKLYEEFPNSVMSEARAIPQRMKLND